MSETHGTVLWSELMTRDVAGAKAYYEAICGWQVSAMEMPEGGTYHLGNVGGAPVAGIMDMTDMPGLEQVPAHWVTYLAVDDVDAAVARTREIGGAVHQDPFDVAGVGRIAMVADPTGAVVGLMTPAAPVAPAGT